MAKKGINIHKRKDGRWEGRYEKGRNPEGRIIYGYVYGKTYREAKEKLTCAWARAPQETVSQTAARSREWSVKDAVELWMESNQVRYKGATCTKYQYLINRHILPELGDIRLSDLSAVRINSFLAGKLQDGRLDRTGGLSPSYVRTIMLVLRGALQFAADEEMCAPLRSPIRTPTVTKSEPTVFSREEQNRLEQCLLAELDPTRLGILLSLRTGLRLGEICALTWDEIDLHHDIIHVRHTIARVGDPGAPSANATKLVLDSPKTAASVRDIPIASDLRPILRKTGTNPPSRFVNSEKEDFLSPRTLTYRYHRLLQKSHLQDRNYHVLRHTFATRCMEAGVDIKSLSEILGHSNVSITLGTYVHSSMEQKRMQLEKLSGVPEGNVLFYLPDTVEKMDKGSKK